MKLLSITILTLLGMLLGLSLHAQNNQESKKFYILGSCVYDGETIPSITLREVVIYKPLVFKSKRKYNEYLKLIRDVKKTLPLAIEIRELIIESYEYIQTLPTEEAKKQHIKKLEKGLKEQYAPKMKKLTFKQGKLLIKLVDRECSQTSYELVKVFFGSFKAGFYQTFASLFGASLKKRYDPEGEDALIERIVVEVKSGQL